MTSAETVVIIILLVLLVYITLFKLCKCGEHKNLFTWDKLWVDHLLYTKLVVNALKTNAPELPALLARLQQNQRDIGSMFGKDAAAVETLLQQHISLAGQTATDVFTESPALTADLQSLYSNSNQIGSFLDQKAQTDGLFVHHMKMHIDTLVAMVVATKENPTDTKTTDAYTIAGLEMAFAMAKHFK